MSSHTPVLLQEVIEHLKPTQHDVVLDGTIGLGGHSSAIIQRLGPNGTLIGLDLDRRALDEAKSKLQGALCTLILEEGNYRAFDHVLKRHQIGHVHKALLDLGLSSVQLDSSGRGFSYLRDEPLHMTFGAHDTPSAITAEVLLNTWDEADIANVLYGYGEERFARRIAREIVERRRHKPITTTSELVDAITSATPRRYHHGKTHFATRTFQALRVAVNDELQNLEAFLSKIPEYLHHSGRLAIISFHSLEDRIVKQTFNAWSTEHIGTVITQKPITPTQTEITHNPRARSAKLRVFEKI